MRRRLLARHPSPAMVVAVVALVSSMTGGAVAAKLITGDDIAKNAVAKKHIKKNAVVSKKVKDGSLKSKDFKAGELVAGAPGPVGPKGEKGDACLPTIPDCVGPKGDKGEPGTNGTNGTNGAQGEPGPLVETLPSGKTLRGGFGLDMTADAAGEFVSDSISFPFPPGGFVTTRVVQDNATPPAQCPGTVAAPQASPGNLCIYVNLAFNTSSVSAYQLPGRHGAVVHDTTDASGLTELTGTWAVTAP